MSVFQSKALPNGTVLHVYPTEQFKETRMDLFLHHNLGPDTTRTALLSQVLMRGSAAFPTMKAIEKELAALFGASVGSRMQKKGERHLLGISVSGVGEKYLDEAIPVLERSIVLASDLLLHPVLENQVFRTDYVQQEKKSLREAIESIYNDKRSYAYKRCVEIMCAGEEYRRHPYGNVEDLDAIESGDLYAFYRRLLTENPLELYVVGRVDPERLYDHCARYFSHPRTGTAVMRATERVAPPAAPRRVVEEEPVQQGKLVVGYRTTYGVEDPEYYAMLMYNQILGGSGNSKLFMNVREKASLAYYVSSNIEGAKGVMFIQAGIEPDTLDQTLEIIDRQLEDMNQGQISDTEWLQSRETLLESMQKLSDSPGALIQLGLSGRLYNRTQSAAEIMERIRAVSLDDVVRVAGSMVQDTVYFLTGKKGGSSPS